MVLLCKPKQQERKVQQALETTQLLVGSWYIVTWASTAPKRMALRPHFGIKADGFGYFIEVQELLLPGFEAAEGFSR